MEGGKEGERKMDRDQLVNIAKGELSVNKDTKPDMALVLKFLLQECEGRKFLMFQLFCPGAFCYESPGTLTRSSMQQP